MMCDRLSASDRRELICAGKRAVAVPLFKRDQAKMLAWSVKRGTAYREREVSRCPLQNG